MNQLLHWTARFQSQIVDLLLSLQERYQLAYLFISHDLRIVKALSHKILVMKRGDIIESGDANEVFTNPESEYAQSLLNAAFGLSD